MTEEAATRFAPHTQDNGIILLDSSWVNDLPESSPGEHYFYPLTEKSSLTFSRPVFANIIAIGFLVTKTKVLSFSGAEVALRKRVPAKYLDANLGALHLGAEIAGTLRPGASAEHPVD
jgi:2-oxoglutarate ferredoxin oxidoreductase subunit gamma